MLVNKILLFLCMYTTKNELMIDYYKENCAPFFIKSDEEYPLEIYSFFNSKNFRIELYDLKLKYYSPSKT